jgi:hypothetical protein
MHYSVIRKVSDKDMGGRKIFRVIILFGWLRYLATCPTQFFY